MRKFLFYKFWPLTTCHWPLVALVLVLVLQNFAHAQSPVDSTWALDHGDTLQFHHDGTREYVRANGNREIRFTDSRRLYFFTPDHFIERKAFLAHNFQELNGASIPSTSLLTFRLAAGYSAPTVFWSAFPDGETMTVKTTAASKKKEYRFSIPFEEPGWHVLEFSANGPNHTRHIIARVLVCVGDHLPLPFDTVVERHGPDVMPRTNDRVASFLQFNRERHSVAISHDSLRDDAAAVLVSAAVTQQWRWVVLMPSHARTILGPLGSMCDSNITAVVTAMGHTPEDLAWNLWTSPTHRALGLIQHARGVAIGVMRVGNELLSAIMVRSPAATDTNKEDSTAHH